MKDIRFIFGRQNGKTSLITDIIKSHFGRRNEVMKRINIFNIIPPPNVELIKGEKVKAVYNNVEFTGTIVEVIEEDGIVTLIKVLPNEDIKPKYIMADTLLKLEKEDNDEN